MDGPNYENCTLALCRWQLARQLCFIVMIAAVSEQFMAARLITMKGGERRCSCLSSGDEYFCWHRRLTRVIVERRNLYKPSKLCLINYGAYLSDQSLFGKCLKTSEEFPYLMFSRHMLLAIRVGNELLQRFICITLITTHYCAALQCDMYRFESEEKRG